MRHLNVGVQHIRLIEGERLPDLGAAVGVGIRERRRSREVAGSGRHVERLAQSGGHACVVRGERERITELLRGLAVNNIERLALRVLEVPPAIGLALQNPADDLAAAVGEGDAVELVLNNGRALRSRLYDGSRGRACVGRYSCRGAAGEVGAEAEL